MTTSALSDQWKKEQAEDIALRHLQSLEPMSVCEMLEGIPEWDALFDNNDPDFDKIDDLVDEIHTLVLSAEVHWPNVLQRYLET
jgi:hypothetical protein